MRRIIIAALIGWVLVAGCQRKSFTSTDPKEMIVGQWTGTYTNPPMDNRPPEPGMEFDFHFAADGKFRMGKRKVWVDGTYQITGPKSFVLNIRSMPAGPYEIVELSSDRLVFERKLSSEGVQRTELRR